MELFNAFTFSLSNKVDWIMNMIIQEICLTIWLPMCSQHTSNIVIIYNINGQNIQNQNLCAIRKMFAVVLVIKSFVITSGCQSLWLPFKYAGNPFSLF